MIALLVLLIAGMFYERGKLLMQAQIKDKLRSTAAAAAMQFDAGEIQTIHSRSDMKRPLFIDTVRRLDVIRNTIPNIRSAYIMRRTGTGKLLEFIADADSLTVPTDTNANGKIDGDEEVALPGDVYDSSASPNMEKEAFVHPVTDENPNTDQWGTVISGYAPILTGSGKAVAILGLDMDAKEYESISQSVLSPLAILLLVLVTALIGGAISLILSRRHLGLLQEMDMERSGLLRLTFHQLGNPLTILKWSLEMLMDAKSPAAIEKYGSSIQEATTRLNNILSSLRDADMVHEGTMHYQPEFASLQSIVSTVAKEFSDRLLQKNQKITLSLPQNIRMNLDKKLITAVLREVVANAIDFSPADTTIIIRTIGMGSNVQIEVHDQGCGVPKADIHRIFNEFARGSNATRFKPDGSGLGLYIIKGIVERAGGTIWMESEENVGSSVYIRLPVA